MSLDDKVSEAARPLDVVILAAGQGTRMRSRRPKVLHEIAGRSMLAHVLRAAESLTPARILVVVGPGMEEVAEAARPHASAIQAERLGTGHAVGVALTALGSEGPSGDLLVLCGDVPLVTRATLERLIAARRAQAGPGLVVLGFRPDDPTGYGRLVVGEDGGLERIVEEREANPAERAIGLCNAGLLLADREAIADLVDRLSNDNAKGEYYLTDCVERARARGLETGHAEAETWEVMGVNSRAQQAEAEAALQARLREAALTGGVTLVDPQSVFLAADTELAADVVVEPHVFFGPGVSVGEGARIRAFSHLEGARVAAGAVIGPYARLRPGSEIGEGARIGNFVETKNARFGPGAKANHLSYVGDAEIGARSNIGAGTITCNYDGFAKHRTELGEGVFIGSNTALVAPIRVEAGAIVGAGSTLTGDVPADALAVARGETKLIDQGARIFRERRRKAEK